MNFGFLLLCLVVMFIAFYWGVYLGKKAFEESIKRYTEEMYTQYKECFKKIEKKYNIKIDLSDFE